MKYIVSILLIIITAVYILPVKDRFMANTEIADKCLDENTDDSMDTKKNNGKELITIVSIPAILKQCISATIIQPVLSALPVHFIIETPPPDFA